MFTNKHALDYSSPLIFDEYDDDFLEIESDAENVFDDPFDSKGEKIKESKLLIDELDIPCDFLPSDHDSFISQDFSRVDAKPLTNNENKVFNPGILSQEKSFEIITHVFQDKKLAISNASSVLEDFDLPFYELSFFKEVPSSKMLLLFSSENKEKVFKPGIHTSEKVHSSFIPELSHQGILKILKTHAEGFCPPFFISSASLGNHSTFPRAVKMALPFAPLLAVLTSSLLACTVLSENVGLLKSSMALTSLVIDVSPFLYARTLLSSEMGMVVLSVPLLHFAGFFV
nr:probable sodium/metabolite cotransporter BASS2, chloroplastic [Tanacetum cinerariifolium]